MLRRLQQGEVVFGSLGFALLMVLFLAARAALASQPLDLAGLLVSGALGAVIYAAITCLTLRPAGEEAAE